MSGWVSGFITIFKTISQILTAGIAITAFSLLLYSLTFNLRDRVARSFSLIMFCLVVIFSTDSFSSTGSSAQLIDLWLRIQWIGIILLPSSYLNFSDALLATTGHPSRWRRKWAIRISNFISVILIGLLATPYFLGDLALGELPAPHFQPTLITEGFTFYYGLIMILSWINFIRSYKRTITKTSKRRMLYLTLSALAPAIGSFPFLLYGSDFAVNQTFYFWLIAMITNTLLGGFVIIMSYAVAFFGVPWPDRVVKSRLFKWLLRGSVTASLTLGIVTIVRRGGQAFGNPYNAFVPIVMVITMLISEYSITMFYPYLEKWLFFKKDEDDFLLIRSFENRIITRSDLRQFLEMVLAAVCDRLQAPGAYLLDIKDEGLELVIDTGAKTIRDQQLDEMERFLASSSQEEEILFWKTDALIPLRNGMNGDLKTILGYLGVTGFAGKFPLDNEQEQAIKTLADRAAIVLRDRVTQEQIFQTLEGLNPQEVLIQQLRAAGRYDRRGILLQDSTLKRNELTHAVKDALTHYWGGPKLTENPLMKLEIVKLALAEHEQNTAQAMRSLLKAAIDQNRPAGDRRYTGEWLLYNILDLKFLEGKKVREIALKLALSEADLYRKQRVAIGVVADTIVKMEMKNNNSEQQ
ncbi:MAG: hypothetical protein NTZ74_03745 [Chloroflexi bacterium]|nr:hypothetical protein [Chloroflexota bacterium]